ncbi:phosphate acetyltransferase [Arcanobacterium wilhelmae]|uniref:Phosphate acetyltransferase n=1 Tax=Arcanobacterium wilhelmae TaxID=1803177 RepID=A0ABT9ND46_9ACTO|nr:phosphate acetyltransferase [Arcanobacterium wilhelmae]MDP9801438.1 phosphate acetyltransferase [Arcanobacterium wilhelmae]WFN90773.1 phosphate acetyltransferase [Arcanobacterium wilhelmae]
MTKSVYFTAAEGNSGTRTAALSFVKQLKADYPNLGVFRSFTNGPIEEDAAFIELLEAAGRVEDLDRAWGSSRQTYVNDEEEAMNQLVKRYTDYAEGFDAVLVLGILDGDPFNPGTLDRAGRATANLGTTMVLAVSGALRAPGQITTIAKLAKSVVTEEHSPVSAVVVTDAPAEFDQARFAQEVAPVIAFPDGGSRELTADMAATLKAAMEEESDVITPLAFQSRLISRARADRKRIVMPESSDDRILRAADELLRREVADIILLGEKDEVLARAGELGLDLSGASIVSISDPALVEKYATEFARLREKKGVTYEQAVETLKDLSYFGTMMVHMGDADGMVSGAVNTTANTIVPSFQIIKTKPGASIVSSCFLMLMEDRVFVYGDCAVNTNPTPEQLGSIAISSAETAQQFGVEPRVAMLSYSTGASGKGPDVDAVVEATRVAKEARPDLLIEGPIQYDAAVDKAVAAKKLPGSPVAGRATVFIFPSLSAGNIGYKAVQRSSGAVAVGPILQGLNKPVNDLSRGALVDDIVNTVAITAIQAQG